MSRQEVNASIGMAVFLGATAMLFATLLLAYAVLRAQAVSWPAAGTPPLPRAILGLNTLVLVASSLCLRGGRRSAALALGIGFLVAQAAVWRALMAHGLGPASGAYGSVFFALSGFHALHVLAGLVVLGVACLRDGSSRLIATYWDFVLVVWIILYLAVCVR